MKKYLKAISEHLNKILQDEDTSSEFPIREWDENRNGIDRRFDREVKRVSAVTFYLFRNTQKYK